MMCVDRVNQVIMEEFGEGGLEAIITAAQFFLMHAEVDDFACEEEKLLLLAYLYFSPDYGIFDDYNPLKHFFITFNKEG